MRHPRLILAARARTQPLGTKPECVLESTVSQSARLSRMGCVGEYLYGALVLVPAALPWLGPELRHSVPVTKNENSQNEPGMCPGINRLTFLVRSTDPVAEARTHRKRRDV